MQELKLFLQYEIQQHQNYDTLVIVSSRETANDAINAISTGIAGSSYRKNSCF
jgi:hypothetical protein